MKQNTQGVAWLLKDANNGELDLKSICVLGDVVSACNYAELIGDGQEAGTDGSTGVVYDDGRIRLSCRAWLDHKVHAGSDLGAPIGINPTIARARVQSSRSAGKGGEAGSYYADQLCYMVERPDNGDDGNNPCPSKTGPSASLVFLETTTRRASN